MAIASLNLISRSNHISNYSDLIVCCFCFVFQSLSALGRHTVCIFGQYHVFVTEQCSSWFGWIIATVPVKTVVINVITFTD